MTEDTAAYRNHAETCATYLLFVGYSIVGLDGEIFFCCHKI